VVPNACSHEPASSLKQQFEDSRAGRFADLQPRQLISAAYAEWDDERKGIVAPCACWPTGHAVTREVGERARPVILDHVKDAIPPSTQTASKR
jgi:hypothetical protein